MLSKHSFFFLKPAVSRKEKSIRKRWDRRSGRRSSGLLGPTNRPSAECRAAVEELEDRWLLSATLANLAIPAAHPTYVILGKQPDAKSDNWWGISNRRSRRARCGPPTASVRSISARSRAWGVARRSPSSTPITIRTSSPTQTRSAATSACRNSTGPASRRSPCSTKMAEQLFRASPAPGNRLGHRGIARRRMGPLHGSRSQHHPVRSQHPGNDLYTAESAPRKGPVFRSSPRVGAAPNFPRAAVRLGLRHSLRTSGRHVPGQHRRQRPADGLSRHVAERGCRRRHFTLRQ